MNNSNWTEEEAHRTGGEFTISLLAVEWRLFSAFRSHLHSLIHAPPPIFKANNR